LTWKAKKAIQEKGKQAYTAAAAKRNFSCRLSQETQKYTVMNVLKRKKVQSIEQENKSLQITLYIFYILMQ
jgi:hypothetical protein